MSITRSELLTCTCGATVAVGIVDSLNAERHPELRQRVLDRMLHVSACQACRRAVVVEHRFLYCDLGRRQIIGVFTRADRANADACARDVEAMFDRWFRYDAPLWLRDLAEHCLVRAVFGLEELREKLVADAAELDDLALEALKLHILAQDPALREAGILTLSLDRVRDDLLELVALGADECPRDALHVPRSALAALPTGVAAYEAYPGLAAGPHVSLLRLALSR
jgi:hypothetical protein